jgi:hypothetical protein
MFPFPHPHTLAIPGVARQQVYRQGMFSVPQVCLVAFSFVWFALAYLLFLLIVDTDGRGARPHK